MRKTTSIILLILMCGLVVYSTDNPKNKVVSEKTDFYELYAPNKKELKKAKKELEFAVKKFKKYFGENPQKIAVYIVNSPEEVSKIDFGKFTSRGLSLLPFVSSEFLNNLQKPETKKAGTPDAKPLSHEAGHKYFITFVNSKKPRKKRTSTFAYGHYAIADWFDEAVATLSEYPVLKDQRNKFLRANMKTTIPLEEFFSMEHPIYSKAAKGLGGKKVLTGEEAKKFLENLPKGSTKKVYKPGDKLPEGIPKTTVGAKIIVSSGDDIATPKDIMFYSQALSIAEFLVSKKGDQIIGEISAGLVEDKKITDILKSVDPKYSDLKSFEKDWKAWVNSAN